MSASKEIFSASFEAIATTIVENLSWSNGTGYYDGLASEHSEVQLPPGKVAKFMSANNRRVIVIGTRKGNAVVFDRYSRNAQGEYPGPCVLNLDPRLEALDLIATTGGVGERDMSVLLGRWNNPEKENIGTYIEKLVEELARND